MLKTLHDLRYPSIVRIAADRIAEGLTLHDVLSATASWGAIAGRRKLKIVQCEAALRPTLRIIFASDTEKTGLNDQAEPMSICRFLSTQVYRITISTWIIKYLTDTLQRTG